MLIKDIYSENFYQRLAASLAKVIPHFDTRKFMVAILPPSFANMEWKERMYHTTEILHQFMPISFAESALLMKKIVPKLKQDGFNGGLEFMFLPEYIAKYGLDDFENAVEALEFLTQFISAEFAVRPFLLKYGDRIIAEMVRMSLHENHHVRRFASEGSRPRLPWGAAIPALKLDPSAIIPILENLKNDPSEYVRRSVANSLNDITKDNSSVVLSLAKKWKGLSKETDAIIKHACRSLLKNGNPDVLDFYGLNAGKLEVSELMIATPIVSIGEYVDFSFYIHNADTFPRYVRLEYKLYYVKNNGSLAGKVFKISERLFQPNEKCLIKRKQSFKIITTRVFYPGNHELAIVVNGEEKARASFELVKGNQAL